ncbi:Cu/Zn superoxide dismutase [Acetobacter estunensis NRIC 0472]|uniref:Superoxide dismutase [Cu-Zn] n=1 Tax=Acetobacter estunensis TaxID=104097 RepID=A0A967BEH9_9PROT|nr:superoxide dismutase family protein [Acetobacter estunensis]NHO54992.1 superoxide dismutase family protein [Acetobacter estunensis]GBQ27864.1 Cu/Zn superoxide dismutase [Acetobacter estunensis NRIC 0472]
MALLRPPFLLAAFTLGLTVLGPFAHAADEASASLIGTDGANHGTAHLTETPTGVLLRIEATHLPAGWHGLHFHEKGVCTPPKFTSAGSHVHAASPVVHGLLNPKANDDGDLPNLFVASDGTATVELHTTLVSLHGTDNRPALLDTDGSSLVIHAKPDDYTTQPIGGAGDRIACGVIH